VVFSRIDDAGPLGGFRYDLMNLDIRSTTREYLRFKGRVTIKEAWEPELLSTEDAEDRCLRFAEEA